MLAPSSWLVVAFRGRHQQLLHLLHQQLQHIARCSCCCSVVALLAAVAATTQLAAAAALAVGWAVLCGAPAGCAEACWCVLLLMRGAWGRGYKTSEGC